MGTVFSSHLGPLGTSATAYLSIVRDHICPFMTTAYQSIGYFQQKSHTQCHKVKAITNWFAEHHNAESQANRGDVVEEEIDIMDDQLTCLWQLCDAIMSI